MGQDVRHALSAGDSCKEKGRNTAEGKDSGTDSG